MDLDSWAQRYRQFATEECAQQPLYVALCEAMAADPELLALNLEVPPAQARPNLLLAVLHDALLQDPAQPLAAYYPSLGGSRRPDAALAQQLRQFLLGPLQPQLRQRLRSRATQTNEPGRCAVLRLALDQLVLDSGAQQLALFDFGCSAGLNLDVDQDAVALNGGWRGPGQRLRLHCDWRGKAPPPAAQAWTLVDRLGVDLQPLDARDPAQARWLQACVWPDDGERLSRLRQALAWADAHPPPVRQHADGLALLTAWRRQLPAGTLPVLLTSWVLAYFSDTQRAHFHARALQAVQQLGVAWICAEAADAHPAPHPPSRAGQTLWSLHSQHQGSRAWAWSHAHGSWAMAVD